MARNIYKITIKDFTSYIVVGGSMDQAYKDLRKYLDDKDKHFSSKRDLHTIEVLATKVNDDDYENVYDINN